METISYPLRIPEEIMALAKLRAKEEYVDQSTALRQLLHLGAEEYVLHLVQSGRLSTSRAAELLKMSIHDIQHLVLKHGVPLGPTREQQVLSRETRDKLLKKKK